MAPENGNHSRRALATMALAELVAALNDDRALLNAVLRLAMRSVDADRGVAFDGSGNMAAADWHPVDAQRIYRQQIAGQGLRAGVQCYSSVGLNSPSEPNGRVVGISVVLRRGTSRYIIAVERAQPFDADEVSTLEELAKALAPLLEQPAQGAAPAPRSISFTDLTRVQPLPHINEVARMLILEALIRFRNNKTAAAAALGMTREGLRKKIMRLGIECPERPPKPHNGRTVRAHVDGVPETN